MQIPIPTIVLGLLLASGAMAARAQPKAPEDTPPVKPAATQASTSLNLVPPPAATLPSAPLDLPLSPAATQASAPLDLALPPAPAAQAGPVNSLPSSSTEVHQLVRWIVDSGDNARLPFLLIDKVNAQVLVFNPSGQLLGAAPALLGMARGDRMLVSNDAKMSQMPPNVRITPAGRFVSRLAKDSYGKELLVLDYDASLSLHPVVKGTPKERRAERLTSATAEDNRISFGCINVPVPFYATIVSPAFTGTKGIVYVLPETSTASALFGFNPAGAMASGAQQGAPALDAPAVQAIPAPAAK